MARELSSSRYERRRARQRSNAAKKGWVTRRENQRKAARQERQAERRRETERRERRAERGEATPGPMPASSARSEAARRGWETRRARERAELIERTERLRELRQTSEIDLDYGDYEIEIGIDYMGE